MKLAIVYHSKFGHTKVIAECIAQGASGVDGIEAVLVPTTDLPAHGDHEKDAGWKHLHEANAIVFGCPTFLSLIHI